MISKMLSSGTLDRRIMRAFYTQYVAVLLIILVVIIGSSRGMFARDVSISGNTHYDRIPKQFGDMSIAGIFDTEQSTTISDTRELEAIAETLRNHDIQVKFNLLSDKLKDNQAVALERARAVRSWLLSKNLPSDAFSVLVSTKTDSKKSDSVIFEPMEDADEIR